MGTACLVRGRAAATVSVPPRARCRQLALRIHRAVEHKLKHVVREGPCLPRCPLGGRPLAPLGCAVAVDPPVLETEALRCVRLGAARHRTPLDLVPAQRGVKWLAPPAAGGVGFAQPMDCPRVVAAGDGAGAIAAGILAGGLALGAPAQAQTTMGTATCVNRQLQSACAGVVPALPIPVAGIGALSATFAVAPCARGSVPHRAQRLLWRGS
jgi:hypothetical protein